MQAITEGFSVIKGQTQTNVIIGFDLDWTIVRPIGGVIPRNSDDWKFLPGRIELLQTIINYGYTVVIFTNQAFKGKALKYILERINNIVAALKTHNIMPWVCISTLHNQYRKPQTAMFDYIKSELDVDVKASLYIGDAAGRINDHSADDLEFAKNCGLQFYTPEEIFTTPDIDLPDDLNINSLMVIFVGMPGSNKTSYYNNYLSQLVHINQDTLKTKAKVLTTIKKTLASKQSMVIDATNPSAESRAQYINLAKAQGYNVVIFYFVANGEGWNKLREHPVPRIAYNVYRSKLVEPSYDIDQVPVYEIW